MGSGVDKFAEVCYIMSVQHLHSDIG